MGGSCSKKEMEQLFKIIDLNKNDYLDRLEITKYLKQNYPTCPINIVDLFIMLADKDRNDQIDRLEFMEFYKQVLTRVQLDSDLTTIVYLATTVSENSQKVTAQKMVQILRCFGIKKTVAELKKDAFDKEEFVDIMGEFFQ
ncbi:EF-hand_domain [Hexamita inflata]|uniref:EF-hand domain n=1 Tax=Hexamita inflata TaxID=28002 RepID=A0AA86R528_9EUKA|nr:EF-hand domain [Hexamita inflata]